MSHYSLKGGIPAKRLLDANEKGIGLVEVLIAIVLLGVIAVPFLMGLSTAFRANLTANTQSIGLSLAQSQAEYIKAQAYVPATLLPTPATTFGATYKKIDEALTPTPTPTPVFTPMPITQGYSIGSYYRISPTDDEEYMTQAIVGNSWDSSTGQAATTDTKIQRIKLVIKFGDKGVLTLEIYKVKR